MVETRSSAQGLKDRQQWARDKMNEAQNLLSHSDVLLNELFSSGDMPSFFNFLSRLYYYDVVNLLLIYDKFPQATHLGNYVYWQSMLPDGAQVLNSNGIGKGIDILAPFNHYDNTMRCYLLLWFCVKVFDVSQTNTNFTPPLSPYVCNENHIKNLLESVKSTLLYKHQYTVLTQRAKNDTFLLGIAGTVSSGPDTTIVLYSNYPEKEQLRWLTEVLIRLELRELFNESVFEYNMVSCISYCLFHLWNVPELNYLSSDITSAISRELRLSFLDIIHSAVKSIDENVSFYYQGVYSTDAELEPSFEDDFFDDFEL